MNLLGISGILDGVDKIADDLISSDEERMKVALQDKASGLQGARGQQQINVIEAQSKSLFVAGWRPFIGWIGGISLAYQFLLYPLLVWVWAMLQARGIVPSDVSAPAPIATDELWVMLTGMLGIAGMRSFDKLKNTQTDRLK